MNSDQEIKVYGLQLLRTHKILPQYIQWDMNYCQGNTQKMLVCMEYLASLLPTDSSSLSCYLKSLINH